MNIIFMGTPDFSVPGLAALAECNEIKVKAVVTQPDRKRGRGQKLKPSPIKAEAEKLGIEVLQSKNVNQPDFLDKLRSYQPDLIIVVAFGQKLSKELLKLPKGGCINLHASLLPEYRGSSPIHQAIIDGKKVTGVTTMYMDEGWDTGDMVYSRKVTITDNDTVGSLHDKLADVGATLLLKTVLDIDQGVAPRLPQDDSKASFAYKLNKEIGEINWQKSSEEIFNLVRGVNPWPGAYTTFNNDLLKIWQVKKTSDINSSTKPGTIIIANDKKGLFVQTGNGALQIKELQLPGRTRIFDKEFLRGYNIIKGKKLG